MIRLRASTALLLLALAPPAGAEPPARGAPRRACSPPRASCSSPRRRGVRVYRREKRPGIELAADGTLAASPERVLRVLLDYPNHRRWQKHLKENRVLRRADGTLDVYQRLDLPVLDDRDFTLHVTWGDDGAVPWMRFAAASDLGPPPVKGVVRVTQHEGGWRLEPADGGKATHAVYRFHLDLAGSFPSWMGKGQAASDVPELFTNITKQLPGYR